MNIKNYTSTVEAPKSMANIEKWLVEIGASNINKTYENKICTGITFLYYDPKLLRTIAFNLTAKVKGCFDIFWKEVKRPTSDTKTRLMEQANRTAWKVLSDWTEVQCTMILLDQATPLQMFLPFTYDPETKETLYDKVMSGRGQLLIG